jgi:hypothetical protein
MHIAERSLFFAISRLLWAFDFQPALDPHGNDIIPDPNELTEGLLVQPKAFPVSISSRDGSRAARVKEEWAKMGSLLDENQQWKVLPEGLIWKEYNHAAKTS